MEALLAAFLLLAGLAGTVLAALGVPLLAGLVAWDVLGSRPHPAR